MKRCRWRIYTAVHAQTRHHRWRAVTGHGQPARYATHRTHRTTLVCAWTSSRGPAKTFTPYGPFAYAEPVAQLLAHSVVTGQDINAALSDPEAPSYHTPVAEWLHTILRPLFDQQFPDDVTYDAEFDAAEVMLGIVVEDLAFQQAETGEGSPLQLQLEFRNMWFGRSVWRSRRYPNPVQEFKDEQSRAPTSWPPAKAGLFGGSTERARAMTQKYEETFEQRAKAYWW